MKKFEEAHSPFTDRSFEEDQMDNFNNSDTRHNMNNSFNSGNQKPEWKRYKQYTRNDILNAIECVKNGMSALQAARKFGVPSRTLYDKVKKMGISSGCQRNRTMKRSPSSNNGSPANFPYGIGGFPGSEQMARSLQHPANLLDPAFLKQALEHRGGDAMHVMAIAAAAHAAANGMSTSPVLNGVPRTPSPNAAMKFGLPPTESYYSRENQIIKREMDIDESGVEDLSVSRKSPSPMPSNSPSPQLPISQKSSVIVSTKLDEDINGLSMKREIMAEDS